MRRETPPALARRVRAALKQVFALPRLRPGQQTVIVGGRRPGWVVLRDTLEATTQALTHICVNTAAGRNHLHNANGPAPGCVSALWDFLRLLFFARSHAT
jgi:hypothetical protein